MDKKATKKAVTRTIYSNYNLWDDYVDYAKESCIENGVENPTDSQIWDEIYEQDSFHWEDTKAELIDFFNGSTWIIQGTCECWTGRHAGGYVFTDFMKMYYKATQDCDYVNFYDENGHLFLECSHHDGTNHYEIKKLTSAGEHYLENWESSYSDKRNEHQVHDAIMQRYSTLPHFMNNVYGCPKVEYEKLTA